MSERRGLTGLGFLVLAAVLAWGGTVDPGKAAVRWIFVAAFACWGLVSLLFARAAWLPERGRIEHVYLQMITLGVAIGAVGWLIPGTDSQALVGVGGLLVLVPLGFWLWSWYRHRRTSSDDPNRPG